MVRNLILLFVSLREVYASSFQKIPQDCSVIDSSKAITQNRPSCWSQGHPAHDPLLGFAFFILWLHRTPLNLRLWFLTGTIFLSGSCCLACSKLQIQLLSGFSTTFSFFASLFMTNRPIRLSFVWTWVFLNQLSFMFYLSLYTYRRGNIQEWIYHTILIGSFRIEFYIVFSDFSQPK